MSGFPFESIIIDISFWPLSLCMNQARENRKYRNLESIRNRNDHILLMILNKHFPHTENFPQKIRFLP
jgi:hypothetical protein